MDEDIAGRVYAPAHRTSRKRDLREFLASAIHASGGRLLSLSAASKAPLHLSALDASGRSFAAMIYPFRCSTTPVGGRRPDERRFQIRYGGEAAWGTQRLGFDPARAEPSIMVGIDTLAKVLLAVDPRLYDPLPSGISIEYPTSVLVEGAQSSWYVWERETREGRRRDQRWSGLETIVAFTPDRLLDWIAFEAEAQALRLDHGLRYGLAVRASERRLGPHDLETAFDVNAETILDIIAGATRLGVAVRGGVAEHHLEHWLASLHEVVRVDPIDEDGRPDFEVTLADGSRRLVECKVCSPRPYASGHPRVEVQKTRSSKGDPASRFYRPEQFDVVAACTWPVTGRWEFRFAATASLARHNEFGDRLAPYHAVDETWSEALP